MLSNGPAESPIRRLYRNGSGGSEALGRETPNRSLTVPASPIMRVPQSTCGSTSRESPGHSIMTSPEMRWSDQRASILGALETLTLRLPWHSPDPYLTLHPVSVSLSTLPAKAKVQRWAYFFRRDAQAGLFGPGAPGFPWHSGSSRSWA